MLRRWLMGRVTGRLPGPPAFRPHRPPYLNDLAALAPETPTQGFSGLKGAIPTKPISLKLAGTTIRVEPGQEADLFKRRFEDVETLLSLHRFAWLTDSGDDIDPAWVGVIWRAWLERFSAPSGEWPWHPYTAGERAVNILAFARRHGLPGPLDETLPVLAAHGPAIAGRLEYFGDHHTSNHLANNGRGLFVLGLELGLAQATEIGARILVQEAKRILTPSGLLREGSSHYHLLYLRLYENVATTAEAAARPEAAAFRKIALGMRKAAQNLMLPGGLPLIGDISPDISPATLLAALELESEAGPAAFAADGWLRFDDGPWSGLWHASPEGFSHMPGHGHQDMGGFELHYRDEPLFIDPGRGAYGDTGGAALYRSATMHNGLMVNGAEPFPPNRPYYDKSFRRLAAGPPPELVSSAHGVTLRHHGFARLPRCGTHERSWRFQGPRMTLQDRLQGRGQAFVIRTLITPLACERTEHGISIRGKNITYALESDGADITLEPVTRWLAYAKGAPATAIRLKSATQLPFDGSIRVEAR